MYPQVAIARARKESDDTIRFLCGEMPASWPEGRYDLIVLSEIVYFLDAREIADVARLVRRDLSPGGLCLLVNWTGPNDLPSPAIRRLRISSVRSPTKRSCRTNPPATKTSVSTPFAKAYRANDRLI